MLIFIHFVGCLLFLNSCSIVRLHFQKFIQKFPLFRSSSQDFRLFITCHTFLIPFGWALKCCSSLHVCNIVALAWWRHGEQKKIYNIQYTKKYLFKILSWFHGKKFILTICIFSSYILLTHFPHTLLWAFRPQINISQVSLQPQAWRSVKLLTKESSLRWCV